MRQRFLFPFQACARRHASTLILTLLLGLACRSQEQPDADSAAALAGEPAVNPPASPKAQPYSVAQFRLLRWLEGRWRGELPQGGYFYEQYRSVDDSTIVMHAFADSTFARATDSARISLRGGVIADEGAAARWVARGLDSTSVDFVPVRGASNSFGWVRESSTRWIATLHSTDREGRTHRTVYRM